MENLQETMTAWLRSSQTTEGQLEIATYGNNLLMAQVTGTDFRLHNDWPPQQWHVFLHVHEGELRLTANGDRIGFDAPVYVDFLSNARWTDVTFVGRYRACFVLVEQQFFMESTQQMRSKVSEGMMRFAQSPFTPMDESESNRLQQLEEAMMATLRNPSLSVQEVAEMLHFADQSAFGKFFKRQCGVSPMQYKKETEQPG